MSYADDVLSHYTGAPADVQKALAAALAAAEKATPAPAPKAGGKAAAAKDPGGYGGAQASETSLKAEVLGYIERPSDLSLSEIKARRQRFADLPDELFEMAEQMSPPGATLVDKLENARKVLVESVKLAEAWPGDGPAARIAAAVKPAESTDSKPLSSTESRPDIMLAKLANEIRASEDVGYGEALSRAKQRDPELAKRYAEDSFGVRSPAASSDRPDVELAERAKARAEKDGVDYGSAMTLELTEDPALASRYADQNAGRTALDEAAYRGETIRAASHGRLSREKAFNAALAEDPKLRAGVGSYFEKTTRGE